MPDPSQRAPDKITHVDLMQEPTKEQTKQAVAELSAALRRPSTPVPQVELDLLCEVALGDTGQSRTCRYLFSLLVGADDPTGFKGEGLLEMRTLDRNFADAFLKILDWWRGPTKSDKPLYDILRKLERRFGQATPEKGLEK